ncbi:hypothetical protein C9I57_07205 [Trinickia symbiotica]|uniref:Uncharacterized protein n=1 Tax=Trinickia symbiotica TaxID=863227 RepID=A0A2T3XY51_9BURK|nr:hypothetical protein [Trinickia symbiotica]PTB21435.1 hypothetical protein C9I57_07205 [Trinickia symbiotica]
MLPPTWNRCAPSIVRAALFAIVAAVSLFEVPDSWSREAAAATPPTPAEIREACEYVADRGPAIRSELLRDAAIDARNDGRVVDATIGTSDGSAAGEILEYRPRGASIKAPPIETSYFDERPRADWGFGARWLRYGGHTYALIFESESLRRVRHLSVIDRKNREHLLCTFTVKEHETLAPVVDAAKPLCRAVATNRIKFLSVDRGPASTLEYPGGPRAETSIAGLTIADFTNSGIAARLVQLEYEHGGGRGGAATYFDVASDGETVSQAGRHKLLMALQHAWEGSSSGYLQPVFAGDNVTRLFSWNGLTYFDIAAGGGEAYDDTPFHEVRSLLNNSIETECVASYRVTWKLSSIAKEFRK